MIVEKDYSARIKELGFTIPELFQSEQELLNVFVKRESSLQLNLEKERQALQDTYDKLKTVSGAVDITLAKHTDALQVQALKKIAALEKKMLRAEKRKFEAQQRQLHKIKMVLFPNNSLQERVENVIPLYAKCGSELIKILYENSLALQQEMVVLEEV